MFPKRDLSYFVCFHFYYYYFHLAIIIQTKAITVWLACFYFKIMIFLNSLSIPTEAQVIQIGHATTLLEVSIFLFSVTPFQYQIFPSSSSIRACYCFPCLSNLIWVSCSQTPISQVFAWTLFLIPVYTLQIQFALFEAFHFHFQVHRVCTLCSLYVISIAARFWCAF